MSATTEEKAATVAPALDLDETLREITRLQHELGLVADTVPSVGRRRKQVAPEDLRAILAAKIAVEHAEKTYRAAVLAAIANGASLREVAAGAGIAVSTLQKWQDEAARDQA